MVDDFRHAAGHTYEVHEVLEGEPAIDLGLRFSSGDYSEAVEFALDYLQSEDSARGGVRGLQIVKVAPSRRVVVWSYSPSAAPVSREDLIRLWGFDPTRPWGVPSGLS